MILSFKDTSLKRWACAIYDFPRQAQLLVSFLLSVGTTVAMPLGWLQKIIGCFSMFLFYLQNHLGFKIHLTQYWISLIRKMYIFFTIIIASHWVRGLNNQRVCLAIALTPNQSRPGGVGRLGGDPPTMPPIPPDALFELADVQFMLY